MAGLDNIKGYDGGGEVQSTPATTTPPPLSAQAVKDTGPYALPTTKTVSGVDPDLLENMRQLIAEREAQKGGFMENLKDATAWWSGGMAGPSEALGRRAKEREEFNATTFGMKRDLAQNKVAQEQAKANQAQIFGTQIPTPTTGTTQSGQQMAGAAPGAQPVGQGGLLGLVRDPALRQSIAAQANRDQGKAFDAIQTYLAKNAEDPTMVKELKYMVDNGLIDKNLIPAAVLTKFVGSGALVPHDVRGAQGTGQATPLGTASGLSPAGGPAPKLPAALAPTGTGAPAPAPAPAPNAVPTQAAPAQPQMAPVQPAVAKPAMPAAAQPAAAAPAKQVLPHTQPLEKIQPPEAAPLVSPNLQTGFAPGTKEDLDAKAAAAQSKINTSAKQQEPIEKAAGESAVALTNAAGKAKDNIQQYDMAESILRQYPKAFGISQDGSVTAMLSQLIGPGVTVPIVGTLKAPGLEEARAQKLGPKALQARATFDTLASRFATEYANQNLTGEGRGTLSNADMKMAGVAKGLNKDSPAASNLIFAILNRENEQMQLERGKAWTQYQKDMRASGNQADFNRFRETEAYTKAMDAKEARIAKRFPEFFQGAAEAPKEKAHPGESLVEKYKTKKD